MPITELSERVAHFPATRPFRRIWDRPIAFVGRSASCPLGGERLSGVAAFLKRSMDVVLSVTGIILLGVPMLLVGLLIKLESGGAVFYRSERLGLNGRRIRRTQFRTMVAAGDDVRVTGVGRFLRRHSLDEVPQLFDVLRGEMSIVGPRPPMASELEGYRLPRLHRLAVKPGVTGLWQVQPLHDPSLDGYVSLDRAYVETWSPWLDLKIMAKAIAAAVAGAR